MGNEPSSPPKKDVPTMDPNHPEVVKCRNLCRKTLQLKQEEIDNQSWWAPTNRRLEIKWVQALTAQTKCANDEKLNQNLRYCAPTSILEDGSVVYRDRKHPNFPFVGETVKTEKDFKK